MPPRLARASLPSTTSKKSRKKTSKRALDAYSIATAENPDTSRIRKHRLGDVNDARAQRKRGRDDEEDDDEDIDQEEQEDERRPRKRRHNADSDVDEGSDSDGNTWQMGHVDEDDDSDIDSDEAFGESDEEKFEGYVFRGSQGGKKKAVRRKKTARDEDLLGEEEDDDEGEESDESFGEDAVDLATMLDTYEESGDEEELSRKKGKKSNVDDMDLDSEDEDDASDSSLSDADGDTEDPQQLLRLQDLITSLQPEEARETKQRGRDGIESSAPSDSAALNSQKIELADLLSTSASSQLKKAAKIVRENVKPSKRNGIPAKIEVPLPKRQQDQIDRVAANQKAKETLERWVDTVKQNRRAEHISFPLKYGDETELQGERRLMPSSNPQNDLESTIQNILIESGLVTKNGNADEEKIRSFEELEAKKIPVHELEARRAELRKARELLFREEVRSKRVNKIKSKAYRRYHRKERQKLEEKERALLLAEGVDLSEEDRELNDRRRAEERMGAKHRESKWAKGVKKSGKAAWDDDARAGVTEMARRNEELRKRVHGKDVRNDSEDDSDVSSGEDESDMEDEDERQAAKIERQLSRVSGQENGHGSESKLAAMAFMQKADAARKAQNDEDIERMRKDLAGIDSDDEADEEEEDRAASGRRKYGPTENLPLSHAKSIRTEFEEADEKEDNSYEEADQTDGDAKIIVDKGVALTRSTQKTKKGLSNGIQRKITSMDDVEDAPVANPWLAPPKKGKKVQSQAVPSLQLNLNGSSKKETSKKKKKGEENVSAPDADGWQTVSYGKDDDEEDSDAESIDSITARNRELMKRAFAGDDAVTDFEAEKKAIAEEEDDKVIDTTLDGWGSWTGDGLTAREQKHAQNRRMYKKQDGIKVANRKDAKLERVVINEKRVRKNSKYLATQLPHEFESRQQYERSLRMPKGPEWSTTRTFGDNTKPRVLMKQGVILPPERPMV